MLASVTLRVSEVLEHLRAGSSACRGGDGVDFWCYGSRSLEELSGSLREALSALRGWGDVPGFGERRAPRGSMCLSQRSLLARSRRAEEMYGTKEVEGRRKASNLEQAEGPWRVTDVVVLKGGFRFTHMPVLAI